MNVVAYTEHPIREDPWTRNQYKVRKLIRYTAVDNAPGLVSSSAWAIRHAQSLETRKHPTIHRLSFLPLRLPEWTTIPWAILRSNGSWWMMLKLYGIKYLWEKWINISLCIAERKNRHGWIGQRLIVYWSDVRIVSPRIILLHNLSRKSLGMQAKQRDRLKHIAVRFPPSLARL